MQDLQRQKIEDVRALVKARVANIEDVTHAANCNPFCGDSRELHLDVGARDELQLVFEKSDWRLGFADGVKILVKAPSSKWSYSGQWFVHQARTFRTGKDGESVNLDGIAKAVEELGEAMRAADRQRAAKAADEAAKDSLRERNRLALVADGILPRCEAVDGFHSPIHYAQVPLGDGVVVSLNVTYRGPVKLELDGLTAEQAADILERLKR